jgi:hypothetical protein
VSGLRGALHKGFNEDGKLSIPGIGGGGLTMRSLLQLINTIKQRKRGMSNFIKYKLKL